MAPDAADVGSLLGWIQTLLTQWGVWSYLVGAIEAMIIIGLTSYALSKFAGRGGDK